MPGGVVSAPASQGVERAVGGEGGIEGAAAVGGVGEAGAKRGAGGVEGGGEIGEGGGEQSFEAEAQRLGEAGGGATGADGEEDGAAFEDGRRGEIAEFGAVDDVDQEAGATGADGVGFACGGIGMGDEGEAGAGIDAGLEFIDDDAAGALDEAALGFGGVPVAQDDDRVAGDAVEQGEAVHAPSISLVDIDHKQTRGAGGIACRSRPTKDSGSGPVISFESAGSGRIGGLFVVNFTLGSKAKC